MDSALGEVVYGYVSSDISTDYYSTHSAFFPWDTFPFFADSLFLSGVALIVTSSFVSGVILASFKVSSSMTSPLPTFPGVVTLMLDRDPSVAYSVLIHLIMSAGGKELAFTSTLCSTSNGASCPVFSSTGEMTLVSLIR